MTTIPKNFLRSTLSTTSGTILHTATTSGGSILTSIVMNNNLQTSSSFNFGVSISGVSYPIFNGTVISGSSSIFVNTHQVILSGQSIFGNTSSGTVTVHLNGVVIS